MAVIPVGFGQANIVFSGGSLPTGAEVTFGFENLGAYTAAGAAAVIRDAWEDQILANQVTAITLDHVLVKLGPNATGPAGIATSGTTGSVNSAGSSPAQAILVQKLTPLGGRTNRGRMYVPGYFETNFNSAGAVDATFLATLQSDYAALLADLTSGDVPMVILHTDPALAPTSVLTLNVDATLATQRRRQRR